MPLRGIRASIWPRSGVTNPDKVYWDSCIYLDYLRGDHPLRDQMQLVIDDWRSGKVAMVASALSIAEILFVRCDPDNVTSMIDRSRESDILALFDPPRGQRFVLVEVSRPIAESARELVWKYNIRPKDAVHVASAVQAQCPLLQTTDKRLLNLDGKVGTAPPLRIELPAWTRQLEVDPQVDPGAFTSLMDPNEPPQPA